MYYTVYPNCIFQTENPEFNNEIIVNINYKCLFFYFFYIYYNMKYYTTLSVLPVLENVFPK